VFNYDVDDSKDLLHEDGRDDCRATTADAFPDAADIGDVAAAQSGDGVRHLVGAPKERRMQHLIS